MGFSRNLGDGELGADAGAGRVQAGRERRDRQLAGGDGKQASADTLLSGSRAVGQSDSRTVGQSDSRTA
jgi:hypothetical protein